MMGSLPDRAIALVGMPGAGKTTIGALLARRLAMPFRDSDAEIERSTGISIAAIFATQGETRFRTLEREGLDRLLDGSPLVLATGGGAMADAATRNLLMARAVTVWLDAPLAILSARLDGQPPRPLLAGVRTARLSTLLAERRRAYASAAYRVDADAAPEMVVGSIITALGGVTGSSLRG